jgi:putative transposase
VETCQQLAKTLRLLFLTSYQDNMPRRARTTPGGYCYHVINRGNNRQEVFHTESDYLCFVEAMQRTEQILRIRLLAYCLMPNHFHLVVWPVAEGDLSHWMQRVMSTFNHRYRKDHPGCGHLWQGRFKSIPVQENDHLCRVIRYVERNPLRGGLVEQSEDWQWSSLKRSSGPGDSHWLTEPPVKRPGDWIDIVNRTDNEAELAAIRGRVEADEPYGEEGWLPAG